VPGWALVVSLAARLASSYSHAGRGPSR
jgi:hypothetical protein